MGRFTGLLGVIVLLLLAWLLSSNRRAIRLKTVGWGLAFQILFAVLVLKTQAGREAIAWLAQKVEGVLRVSEAGSTFLFGPLGSKATAGGIFYFAFQVLPTIIFISALFAILYYYGVMQAIVRGLAIVMTRLMGTSGAESLNTAANIFMGQTESPLTIRPYLSKLTQSELMLVMTAGMTTVSGAILGAYIGVGARSDFLLMAVAMAAPAAVVLAKIMVPETEQPLTAGQVRMVVERQDPNVLGAAARGTTDGLRLAVNVGAMLIAFLALLALINLILGGLHEFLAARGVGWFPQSLEQILGWLFCPVAWLLGVPWHDAARVGSLLGLRMVTNEVVAYEQLVLAREALDPKSLAIATFALCGFANIGSIGIQIGGIGALAPERRDDLARLGFRAMLAGTMANFMSAAIAGMLL
ncbi:MAG: NupC/NupG family nucleoside CNT transporter [Acidobacteriia bacterium]|jgi:CNT family concentrative nucleoside transporter|nr:NupC/NupG family nucleoside CNT transporter [Terriglobia bacterium]